MVMKGPWCACVYVCTCVQLCVAVTLCVCLCICVGICNICVSVSATLVSVTLYVYMSVCLCMYMDVTVSVCDSMSLCVYVCVSVMRCVYMCVCIYLCMCVCVHVCGKKSRTRKLSPQCVQTFQVISAFAFFCLFPTFFLLFQPHPSPQSLGKSLMR